MAGISISFYISGFGGTVVIEVQLSKLGIRYGNMKKLLVERARSTSTAIWRQSAMKISGLMCSQDFISAHSDSDLKFESFQNINTMDMN